MTKRILISLLTVLLPVCAFGQVIDESFENWIPEGWKITPEDGKTWMQSEMNCDGKNGPGKACDGQYAASINFVGYPLSEFDMETPMIDVSGFNNPELSFAWYYNGSTNEQSYIEVLAGYENSGKIDYVSISKVGMNVSTADWTEHKRVLNREVKKIILRVTKKTGATFKTLYVDKLLIKEGPEVAPPINPDYEYIAENDGKIKFTWEAINDENCWNLKISDTPINPDSETAGIEENDLTQPEYIAENLKVNSHYYFYVQTVASGKTSEWSELDLYLDPAPSNIPLTIDFENDNGGFSFVQERQANAWYWGSAAIGNEGGKSLYISDDGGASYSYSLVAGVRSFAYKMISFPEKMNSGATVSFDFKGIGWIPNHSMELFLIEDLSIYPVAGSFLSPIQGKIEKIGGPYGGYEDWTEFAAEIPASYAGKTVRFVIGWRNNEFSGDSNMPASIDNIKIEEADSVIPKNVEVTEITTNSITLNWDVSETATEWEVEYGSYDFQIGGGTVVKVIQEPPFALEGLEDCRHYGIVVRAIGDGGVSESSERIVASTKSLDKTAPYINNFDDLGVGMFPAGWQYYTKTATAVPYLLTGNEVYYHSAPNCMMMIENTGQNKLTLISPPFSDLKDRKSRITFYANINPLQYLTVGIMSDPSDLETFIPLKKYMGNEYVTVNSNGQSVSDTYRHILYLDSEFITENHKYIAFLCGETFQKPTSIDDFVYERIPELIEPADLRILDVFDTSARMTWTVQGKERKWEVAYDENDFDFDEQTAGVIVEGDPMIVLTNLNPNSFYTAYVRAVNENDEKGPWSESYFFRTCQEEYTLPFMETFDDLRLYGIVPPGWGVVDYSSLWSLTNNNYNSYPNCVMYGSTIKSVNDWLFTPPFNFEKDEKYMYSFRVKSSVAESAGKISVHYGPQAWSEAMGEAIVTEDKLTDKYILVKMRFIPEETGYYNIGINYQDTSSKGLWIDDVMLQKDRSSGIDSNLSAQSPVIYPTVAKDEIRIRCEKTPVEVSIFNLNGALIWGSSEYMSGMPISVADMANGNYIVQVVTADNSYCCKIIICK